MIEQRTACGERFRVILKREPRGAAHHFQRSHCALPRSPKRGDISQTKVLETPNGRMGFSQ